MNLNYKNKLELEGAKAFFLSCLEGKKDKKLEEKLWKRVEYYVGFLGLFPFVKMVAVGNSLAFGRINKDSDIDLFIVAKRGRIFFVRTLVTAFFQILGVRRYGDKVAGRFCLSFFVSDDGLDLSSVRIKKDDIYLFFWVLCLKPVLGVECYWDFVRANGWVKEFGVGVEFESDFSRLIKTVWVIAFYKWIIEVASNVFLIWWLEPLLRSWQIGRAERKRSMIGCGEKAVIVNDKMLKFHDKDARLKIRNRFLAGL